MYKTTFSTSGAIFAALCGGVCLTGCSHSHKTPAASDKAYESAIANAKRSGLPVAAADMAKPMPPESENAGPIYSQLIDTLKANPLSDEDKILDTYCSEMNPSPAETQQAEAALKRRSDLMTLVHRAAARPKCVFNRNWDAQDPSSIPLPELAKTRQAARFLSSESQVMAFNGQGLAAARNETLGFRIARHGASDGLLINLLLQMAIDQITLKAYQKIMLKSHGDAKVADAVVAAIDANWKPPLIVPFLRSETAFEASLIEWLRNTGPQGLVDLASDKYQGLARALSSTSDADWNDILNKSGLYLLVEQEKIRKAADLPFPAAFSRETALETAQGQEARSPRRIVCAVLLVSLSPVISKRATAIATARVTRAGAAILAYRAAHGAPPSTLNAAISPAPVDPFDLKPLRYRQEGSGFVVYSVGSTLRSDGGAPGRSLSKSDIAFRYP